MFGELFELSWCWCVEVTSFAHAFRNASHRLPVDTIPASLAGSAGEANSLRLRGIDREHHVKVCVLVRRLSTLKVRFRPISS